MNPRAELACDVDAGHCHLCGDEAHVARIVSVAPGDRSAIVFLDGATTTIALDLVDASPGDDVLVHAGFAIGRVASE